MTSTTDASLRAHNPPKTALAALVALGLSAALPSVARAQTAAPGATAQPAAPAEPAAVAQPAVPAAPQPPSRISVLLALPRMQAPAGAEQDRQARTEFLAGREAFSRGQFLDAAERFERAYELSRRAALLYNLGTSYDRLHRWEEARLSFQRYLRDVPAAPEREEVAARLTVIEQTIARENEMREAARRAALITTPRVVVVERPRDRIVVQRVGEPRPWLTTAAVVGGVAVIGGIVATVIGVLANADYQDAIKMPGGCAYLPLGCDQRQVIDDIALRQTFTNGLIVGSSALAAFSVVAFVLDARRTRPAPIVRALPGEPEPAGAPPGGAPSAAPARSVFAPTQGATVRLSVGAAGLSVMGSF